MTKLMEHWRSNEDCPIDNRRNHQHHQPMAGKVQESYFGCMKRISVIVKGISTLVFAA
jgi:hypothetical protein